MAGGTWIKAGVLYPPAERLRRRAAHPAADNKGSRSSARPLAAMSSVGLDSGPLDTELTMIVVPTPLRKTVVSGKLRGSAPFTVICENCVVDTAIFRLQLPLFHGAVLLAARTTRKTPVLRSSAPTSVRPPPAVSRSWSCLLLGCCPGAATIC